MRTLTKPSRHVRLVVQALGGDLRPGQSRTRSYEAGLPDCHVVLFLANGDRFSLEVRDTFTYTVTRLAPEAAS